MPVLPDIAVYTAPQWPALRQRYEALEKNALLVVCLCAEWCAVCRDFKPVYQAFAQHHAHAAFAYLDIEDDSEILGHLDLDNFPTLAVFRGNSLLHFGVIKARRDNLTQLLRSLERASPLTLPFGLQTLYNAIVGTTFATTVDGERIKI